VLVEIALVLAVERPVRPIERGHERAVVGAHGRQCNTYPTGRFSWINMPPGAVGHRWMNAIEDGGMYE
jgi:hypothetical protein